MKHTVSLVCLGFMAYQPLCGFKKRKRLNISISPKKSTLTGTIIPGHCGPESNYNAPVLEPHRYTAYPGRFCRCLTHMQ